MSPYPVTDRLLAWCRGAHHDNAVATALLDRWRFDEARTLVRVFYAVLAYLAIGTIYSWPSHLAAVDPTPRWPIAWLAWVDLEWGIAVILWLHLAGGLAALVLVRHRWARVLVALSLLWFLSFRFSFGSINHGDHLGLLLAWLLVLLPPGWTSRDATREVRASTLLVVSACQGLILLIYSLSGVWKVVGVLRQLFAGEVSYVSPSGMSQLIAAKLLGAEASAPLGPWMIEHSWLGWPLGVAAIYVELVSLFVLFRPALHRAWGLALIGIHLFALLTMGVGFVQNTLWLALFLVLSPFRPRRVSIRTMLAALPMIGSPLLQSRTARGNR